MKIGLIEIIAALALSACGGGGDGSPGTAAGPQLIGPGQSIVMTAGQTVIVPVGTTVYDPATNSNLFIGGHTNVIHTAPGAQVIVPSTATGVADNTVTTL